MMKIKYKGQWFSIALQLVSLFLWIASITQKDGFVLTEAFDYEGFEPHSHGMIIGFLFMLCAIVYQLFFMSRIEIKRNGLRVTGWNGRDLRYTDLKGVSVTGKNVMVIHSKAAEKYLMHRNQIENYDELQTFLLHEKELSRLPNNFKKTWSIRKLKMGSIMLVIAVGLFFILRMDKEQYPLLNIEVNKIEGVLSKDMKITAKKLRNGSVIIQRSRIEVEEHSNMFFYYPSEVRLSNRLVDIEEGETILKKGTKVLFNIRSGDYFKLDTKENIDTIGTGQKYLRYYSLEVEGEKLFEKNYLEEVPK